MGGPVDAVAFDSKTGFAYADEDDGSRVFVIDVKRKKLVKTIKISGIPEFIVYDPKTDRLYQNIKSNDQIAVINPKTNEVEAEWSTFPATSPHGLAIDSETGHLFSVGHNDQLVEIDVNTGKVIANAQIATGSDQISFDTSRHIVYCAAKGFISAVQETKTGLEAMSLTSTHAGSHTIAVDSFKRDVWVSFGDEKTSSLQKFSP